MTEHQAEAHQLANPGAPHAPPSDQKGHVLQPHPSAKLRPSEPSGPPPHRPPHQLQQHVLNDMFVFNNCSFYVPRFFIAGYVCGMCVHVFSLMSLFFSPYLSFFRSSNHRENPAFVLCQLHGHASRHGLIHRRDRRGTDKARGQARLT